MAKRLRTYASVRMRKMTYRRSNAIPHSFKSQVGLLVGIW